MTAKWDKKQIILFRLFYLENIGDKIKKRWFKKVQLCVIKKVYFCTRYEAEKLIGFCSLTEIFPHYKNWMLCIASYFVLNNPIVILPLL